MDTKIDNVQTLIDAGRAIGAVPHAIPGGYPAVIIPNGYKLEQIEMVPAKVGRAATFQDAESFALYVNIYKSKATLLFAELTATSCKITARLDYHGATFLGGGVDGMEWWSHSAVLNCVLTKEWSGWMERNGSAKPFSQVEFAQFLEDNERLLRDPDAASLLDMITTLEGKSHVRFNSSTRLQNGKSRLDYEEDVKLTGGIGTGAIEIPRELILGIIPFENGEAPYEVRARLRYRIQGRALSFWYETIAPHLILRDASNAVLDIVREKVKAPILIGD